LKTRTIVLFICLTGAHVFAQDPNSGKRDGRPLAPRTVRHIGFTVHDALQDAFRLELIAENPMKRVKLPKPVKKTGHRSG
jgi:hypothetical protein